ncbi:putative transcription elongation factor SPT5-like protein 1 [Dichanthelium oligosanthes]|uniref:Transcription elongation factor SPT5 n=1 Tax=Dichanthelium oligosanthes TaxID=888268 RepID=A0A1E5V8J7_9POAL|nr:putative transcription elongation factor SPT5-like protein 1 [Dichanthelium oligosanthes]
MVDDEEDVQEYLRRLLRKKTETSSHFDYDEEVTEVEQQALLPSVKDPKLWMVKCAIGHERETAVCLMQKFIDRPDLQIKSVVALEHLKNFIYIEAEKEAHVKEACKGLRNIIASAKIILVPIREMADVLSVESKSVDLSRDSWVRMKLGLYKGDLAKVTVKVIPRIDLQELANKLDGNEVTKKKSFVTPPRFFSVDEAREMHIRVDRRRNRDSGEYFDVVGNLMFKDGFLYKTFSIKSINSHNIQPSFDELEKFKRPGDDLNEDVASLSTLCANRKKGHFMKGDAVIVIKGDLKNLKGSVEKVEDGTVHIQSKLPGLPRTLAFSEKDLCKYFNPGDHVKVVSGIQEGVTGMVVKVEGHVLIILSDTTKEHVRVFADNVVESSEVTTGITRIGDYELHDLVLLKESKVRWNIYTEAYFLSMIATTLNIQDLSVQNHNLVSLLGAMDTADPHFRTFSYPARILQSPGMLPPRGPHMNSGGRFGGRGGSGRGHDALVNRCIKIKSGPYKGYRGRVKEVTGALVRIELDSLMKIVTVKREAIGDTAAVATPFRDKWEDGDPSTWASNPAYQPGTPRARPYEAPTPGSGWSAWGDASGNTPSTYAPSTPIVQPMTPVPAASYLPGTPGGQPMTPGDAGMDLMSPVIGGEAEGNWLLPDVLVNISRGGDEVTVGVVKEVLPDGSCRVALGSLGNGDELIVTANELGVVRPKKNENLKIMNGSMRGVN